MFLRLGGSRCGIAHRLRQSGEFVFTLEHEELIVLFGEHVLAELREQARELLIDLGKTLFRFRVQARAGMDEVCVIKPGHALLFGREPRFGRRVVDCFDSFEEWFVLCDLIVEGREAWGHLSLDHLELRATHRRAPNSVNRCHAIERVSAAFESGDGIFEIRRRGIAGDALNLAELFSHRGFESRFKERYLNAIKWRNATIRAFPLCK